MGQLPLDLTALRTRLDAELAATGDAPDIIISLERAVVAMLRDALEHVDRKWDAATLRPLVLAELGRLAVDGQGVSKARWNEARQRPLPDATRVCRVLHADWNGLMQAAGLKPNRYQREADEYIEALDDPAPKGQPDPELEPVGLDALSVRVEKRRAGNVQIVSEIYTLR